MSRRSWIRKVFAHSRCGDELLIQTLLINSPYKKEVTPVAFDDNYMSCLRYIDWKRGKPYVFRNENFEELINSPHLFARKFDMNVDGEVIDKLFEYLKGD